MSIKEIIERDISKYEENCMQFDIGEVIENPSKKDLYIYNLGKQEALEDLLKEIKEDEEIYR